MHDILPPQSTPFNNNRC